jgi:hypothetical protein
MWNDAVVVQFEILSQHLFGTTEENVHKILSEDIRSPGPDLVGPEHIEHTVTVLCITVTV